MKCNTELKWVNFVFSDIRHLYQICYLNWVLDFVENFVFWYKTWVMNGQSLYNNISFYFNEFKYFAEINVRSLYE